MFDKNFYPTPEAIIKKMLKPFHKGEGEGYNFHKMTILEPSAGKGDIIDFIEKNSHNCGFSNTKPKEIYCIEKNEELQMVLLGKHYKLIDQDFLGYAGDDYDFDLIVMNPPFAEGAKHFLKAWEIMKNGKVICLLNAETLKNPYTKERELIQKIIKDNSGSVEFIENGFSDSERKTNVEIALINIDKKTEKVRFEFDDFDKEELNFSEDIENTIATSNILKNFVLQYETAKKDFEKGLALMEKMNKTMKFLTGKHGIDIYENIKGYGSPKSKFHGFLNDSKLAIWLHIVQKLGIEKYMTERVQRDFREKVEKMGNMAITEANIKKLVSSIFQNRVSILEENIVVVFDLFTKYYKENRCHIEGWKTNDSWKVNKKVILPYFIECKYGNSYGIAIGRSNEFQDIEKCMCYLSGKNYDNINSLSYKIEKVEVGNSSLQNSEFFNFRCYKKGTLHLHFKDDWLWEEFNMRACAGKNWLPEAEREKWEEERKANTQLRLK